MEMRCMTEECDSEFFTPDNGGTIFNTEGEIESYPARDDDREPRIRDVYDEYVLLEWVPVVGDKDEEGLVDETEEEIILLDSFRCMECGGGVEFIA